MPELPELETEAVSPIVDAPFDPSEPPAFQPDPFQPVDLAAQHYGLPPLSRARQWLFEHRRLDMKPYVDFRPEGPVAHPRDSLESMYPGVADKVKKARRAGYDDRQIMLNIADLVDKALNAGYTDGMIAEDLYQGYKKEYGFWERPIASFLYGRPENVLEKAWDYLGTTPDYHTSPIKHEIRAVVERGISGFTGGLSDLVQEEAAYPESIPGTIAGIAANLTGFLLGPLKAAKVIIGGRLAPTAVGLRGVAQLCVQGGATLSLASTISSIIPVLQENESVTEAGVEILESAGLGALTGFLYPLAGIIPTKPLRLAVGLAALDLIRNKGDFTIDDVVRGVRDGTIDREELAERSFSYLMDLYFLNKVPSMKQQLVGLEKNAIIRRMLELNPEETEGIIIRIRGGNLIPKSPERFLDGLGKWDKIYAFGSEKNFNATYKMLQGEQVKLAEAIQNQVAGKATIRIPKELAVLSQIARQFRKAVNFEAAVRARARLTEVEKASLQQVVGGDLRRFWQAVQDRIYLEKRSMLQHKGQAEKILDAMQVETMYNRADTELARLSDGKIRKAFQAAARAVWDTSANIKRDLLKKGGALGKEAVIRHDLIRGSTAKADRMVNEAYDRIYAGLTKSEEIALNRIIQSRRIIAIEKYRADIKHPAGLGLKEHQGYLDSLPKELSAKLRERANTYFAEMDSQLSQLHKAGIISKESYRGLLEKGDYSPRRFIQHIDAERTYTFGGKKITVWDSGIKALDEGSYRALENNSRSLLAQVVTRTQARIFRNEANRALYEMAKQVPNNGIVQLAKIQKTTKQGKPIYAKTPAGFEKLGVMVDGQYREMIMPSTLAKEWVTTDPAVSNQTMNIIGWLSGAKILRPMATGLNPEFALTNLPRDIAHAWITTHEYSPHLPVAAVQMAKDYIKVFGDTIHRSGAWLDYINEGGGMSFLTHQGRIQIKGKVKLPRLQKFLGWAGETSEIWTRLALRERALRNGKQPHEATWVARTYLDFSQGGSFIKGVDAGIPYLNASVQGTRGMFRAAKEKPAEFVYKIAEVGTLATGIYLANRYGNPECWDSISPYDKANNFIITTPLSYTDDEGNKRHLYFKIAKDQSQKLACTIFENMMAKYLGEDIDVDEVTLAAKQLIAIVPTEALPPTMDAILGYASNIDFWRNDEIWKRGEIESAQEYTQYTHPAFVKIGEITGMSPERTRYALQQYFTYGNIYTSLTGGGLRLIMDKLPEDTKDQTVQDMLRQAPFLRRVLKATDPFTEHRKDLERIKLEEQTRRYIQSRTLDGMSEQYYANQIDQDTIKQFILQQPWQDRERLVQRHQRYGKLHEIPDKRWWLNMIDMPAEARATVYWTRWQQADKAERGRLDKYLRKVPGVISEKFMLRLNQLKAK